MKLAARVHKSKDNRLILIAVDLETGKQPGMSVALKELDFQDGDMIEFRRIRQASPDPKPEPKQKSNRRMDRRAKSEPVETEANTAEAVPDLPAEVEAGTRG